MSLTPGNIDRAIDIAKEELKNGCAGGEALRRTMMLKHQIQVPRSFAREIVQILDGEGVRRRKRKRLRRRQYINKGPNYVWHIDGYDKLTPFGFPIHGCIDGFSRQIVWLKVGFTNKKPEVIAGHFVAAVEELKGYPVRIRADPGTENILVARMQRALADKDSAFIYGTSTSNQRIERFWGLLRQYKADFWIDHFKTLIADGLYDRDNPLERLCMQYSYMDYLQKELNSTKVLWNTHTIRKQHVGDVLSGVPQLMFGNPELFETRDYINFCLDEEKDYLKTNTLSDSIDADFKVVADDIVAKNNYKTPQMVDNIDSAKNLFVNLKAKFINQLD
ncbi:hypothetical protein ACF0H5_021779 [Mactra antiquata]